MKNFSHENENNFLRKVSNAIQRGFQEIKRINKEALPGSQALKGAGIGAVILGFIFTAVMVINSVLPAGWLYFLIVLILIPISFFLGTSLLILILKNILKLPEMFLTLSIIGFLLAVSSLGLFDQQGFFIGGLVLLVGGLTGAGFWTLIRGYWERYSNIQKIVSISALVLGITGLVTAGYWLMSYGQSVSKPEPVVIMPNLPGLDEIIDNPSDRGDYPVGYLTYGSGVDRRRAEFGNDVDLITNKVDGSSFVRNWSPIRSRIWGIDPSSLPINGRIWYPEAEGAFPLVLVVHGNHLAEDHSDPGYGYLCELLASRGSICVSVDQNFLNGSFVGNLMGFRSLENENDLRGWLLLKHISAWEEFSQDPASVFYDSVDLNNIALIGHSRGGEAAAIAGAFNKLSHYPDNAKEVFEFNFGIRSIVGIAPIDRQYQPSGAYIPLEDVNYLVLHGSHDMDVTSFDGYNAFSRADFNNEDYFIKSTLYIWGANHGQFNTVWGNNDRGTPTIWVYNRRPLIAEESQRQIAKIYISAFVDATLKGNLSYLPLFENYQSGMSWLPEGIYLNAFSDSNTVYLAQFDEDIDLTTGSKPGVTIHGENLTTWYEDRVGTKWGKMHSSSAAYLGWGESESTANYTLSVDKDLVNISLFDQLTLSIAQVGKNLDADNHPVPVDFSIRLSDGNLQSASLPLSTISPLQPELEAQLFKAGFLSKQPISEIVFQTYLFDFDDFSSINSEINLSDIKEISLIFDQTSSGLVAVDSIGLRQLP